MGRLTIGQKAERVTRFLVGIRKRRVASALARCGFGPADLAEGWRRLSDLTMGRLDVTIPDGDPKLVDALDTWENEWFLVANASIRRRYPAAHEFLFKNLGQTEGLEVITSVGTFVARLDKLGSPEADGGLGELGVDARALLVKRGLDDRTVDIARDILAELGRIEPVEVPPELDEEEDARREKALWDWYLEWSEIARARIKNGRALRSLGFGGTGNSENAESEQDADSEDTDLVTPNVATPPPASDA